MADPMKIRAQLKGDSTEIRVLMSHPMETGTRKDQAGNVVPAHFINHVTVKVGDKTVVDGQVGQGVAKNPVFGFRVKGAKAGDKVVVTWKDNKGETRTDEAAVTN